MPPAQATEYFHLHTFSNAGWQTQYEYISTERYPHCQDRTLILHLGPRLFYSAVTNSVYVELERTAHEYCVGIHLGSIYVFP